MNATLGYEKNSIPGNDTSNSSNGNYPEKIQTKQREAVISIPRDRNGLFEPIAMPSIKLVEFLLKILLFPYTSKE